MEVPTFEINPRKIQSWFVRAVFLILAALGGFFGAIKAIPYMLISDANAKFDAITTAMHVQIDTTNNQFEQQTKMNQTIVDQLKAISSRQDDMAAQQGYDEDNFIQLQQHMIDAPTKPFIPSPHGRERGH